MQLSVIIPIYNSEKYLAECIDSVLAQTFQDFELILVDDGSTDCSSEICDRYAASNNRIRVIHKSNEGSNCARVAGLKSANGEYIAFVDADDWIDADFLETMMESILHEHADIVITGCIKEKNNKAETVLNNIPSGIYEGDSLVNVVFSRMQYYGGFYRFGISPYLWNKLYRRELLMSCYENMDMFIYDGEDAAVVYPYILKTRRVVILPVAKYHYRLHENSMTARKRDDFYKNCCHLYLQLDEEYKKTPFSDNMHEQLDQNMRYLIWMGKPECFDGTNNYLFPFGKVKPGADIVLYAAGKVGREYYRQIKKTDYCNIAAWVDKKYYLDENILLGIEEPDVMLSKQYDHIVIAIESRKVADLIKAELEAMGIDMAKVIWEET